MSILTPTFSKNLDEINYYPISTRIKIEPNSEASLTVKGLNIKISRKTIEDGWKIIFQISANKKSIKKQYSFHGVMDVVTEVILTELDQNNKYPEIIFSGYTGGAHCCTIPVVLTNLNREKWAFFEFGLFDGDLPLLEDLDNNGTVEIVSFDHHFLYAFDSYADSFAPNKIYSFKNYKFNEITKSHIGKIALKNQLIEMEVLADNNPRFWHSHGFLSAWVAIKMLLGDGHQAWRNMILLYNRNPSYKTAECKDKNSNVFECDEDKLVYIPFPIALEDFLKKNKYWKKSIYNN